MTELRRKEEGRSSGEEGGGSLTAAKTLHTHSVYVACVRVSACVCVCYLFQLYVDLQSVWQG